MLRITSETNLGPQEVIDKAIAYFKDQLGMKVKEKGNGWAYFEGNGSSIDILSFKGVKSNMVEFVSEEKDNELREFIRLLSTKP